MCEILKDLNWRYATKQFDQSKKLSPGDLDELLEAVRLSASSFGLQPYEILVISDEETRKKLREVSWNQPQVTDASHLIIFCNKTNLSEKDADKFLENISQTRSIPMKGLSEYSGMMKGFINNMSDEQKSGWTSKQAYLALGFLLVACASNKIDACPMEGFDKAGYDKILNLSSKGLEAAVIVPIGYRSENDDYQHLKKVRKTKDTLFTMI